jgi:hypothetical protein
VPIQIYGLTETIRMLETAPRLIVANGFLRGFSAAGNVFADALESNTPEKAEDIGGVLDKGELRASIVVAPVIDAQYRGGYVDVGFTPSNSADSVALWLDRGHRIVTRSGRTLGQTTGTGFMRKSADIALDAAVEAFVQAIRQSVSTLFPSNP